MNCKKCGFMLMEGSNICNYCGFDNSPKPVQPPPVQQIQRPAPPPIAQNYVYAQVPSKYTKKCRYCKQVIDKKASICPFCHKQQGESCLSATIFVLLVVGFFCFIGNAILNRDKSDEDKTEYVVTSQDESGQVDKSAVNLTKGQENALKQAKNYLELMPFSAKGLIEQLEYEGYTHDDAVFAVNNCGADWNEQAVKKANSYLSIMAFSRQGLIEQLEFEGFTHEQAEYALQALGY